MKNTDKHKLSYHIRSCVTVEISQECVYRGLDCVLYICVYMSLNIKQREGNWSEWAEDLLLLKYESLKCINPYLSHRNEWVFRMMNWFKQKVVFSTINCMQMFCMYRWYIIYKKKRKSAVYTPVEFVWNIQSHNAMCLMINAFNVPTPLRGAFSKNNNSRKFRRYQ